MAEFAKENLLREVVIHEHDHVVLRTYDVGQGIGDLRVGYEFIHMDSVAASGSITARGDVDSDDTVRAILNLGPYGARVPSEEEFFEFYQTRMSMMAYQIEHGQLNLGEETFK